MASPNQSNKAQKNPGNTNPSTRSATTTPLGPQGPGHEDTQPDGLPLASSLHNRSSHSVDLPAPAGAAGGTVKRKTPISAPIPASAGSALAAVVDPQVLEHSSNSVIVQWRISSTISDADSAALRRDAGVESHRNLGIPGLEVWQLKPGVMPTEVVAKVSPSPLIEYIELDAIVQTMASTTATNTAVSNAAVGNAVVVPIEDPPHASDSVIVKLNQTIKGDDPALSELRKSLGVESHQTLANLGLEIWKLTPGIIAKDVTLKLSGSPLIEFSELDYIITTALFPNDTNFSQLWGLHNTGQAGGLIDADIDAPEAWDYRTGNDSMVIAVIDTGVAYNHPELAGNIYLNTAEVAGDGIDNDANGYIDDIRGWDFAYNDNDPMDVHGHGTHVAGTIAARGNNSLGVTGVMWNAKIMPIKFLNNSGSGLLSNAILAINYATNQGVKITNNSWGGGPYSQALYNTIQAAGQAGALFVAAAGNAGANADINPMYPAAYNLANIISVASTTRTDSLSGFSNYGAVSVDLGAPGSDIYSTMPGNSYGWMSGTSMAAPHVAGAAGLLWSQSPGLTVQQVKSTLMTTGDPLASLAGRTVSGRRLNIGNALASVSLPVITVVASDATAAETAAGVPVNPGQFTLSRTGPTTASLTVRVSLGGTATNGTDYTSIPTTATFAAGSATAVVNVTVRDDLLVEGTETVALTLLSGTGYSVGTPSTATVSILDNDLPVITVVATDATAAETATGVPPNPGRFTLSRTGSTSAALTVALSLGGTATNGTDYTSIPTTASFAAGSATALINVSVLDDLLVEGTETVALTLLAGAGYSVGTPGAATVSILDNDPPVITVVASDATAAETAAGVPVNPGQFTLSRTGPTTASLTVRVSLGGTATNGTDYTSIPTTATFAAGSATAVVNVTVRDDLLLEGTETVALTLLSGTGYSVGTPSTATVSILDNDLPVITVVATDATAAETAAGVPPNPGQFTLSRTGSTSAALTVALSLGGTATNGTDYTSIPATASFAAGSATALINVSVLDDLLVEGTETVALTLLAGAGYSVGTPGAATVSILDNDFPVSTAIIPAHDKGWYDGSGFHNPSNPNYIAGDYYGSYRNFFAFNLPLWLAPIISAQLAINTHEYTSSDLGEKYQLHDVSTAVPALLAGGTGQVAIFNDLGDGVSYGSTSYSDSDDYTVRYIDLNAAAISALGANGGQAFAIGGQLTSLDQISNEEYVFGFSHLGSPTDVRLIVNLGAAPPEISVTASDASAAETAAGLPPNPGRFTLSRTGDLSSTLTVNIGMAGTATNGADYAAVANSVLFPVGAASVDVLLSILDDQAVEGTETAILNILSGNGYRVSNAASATASIQDNDTVPNTLILNPADTGWYDDSGYHNPSNTNYIAGDYYRQYRNFFVFNLPVLLQPIFNAQLLLNTFDYDSSAANETFQLLEVKTPVSTLVAGGSGQLGIYNDLGDGVAYGVRTYVPADDDKIRVIDLNTEAINALMANSGQAFALGGMLTSLDTISNSEYVFGFSNSMGADNVRLVLNTGAPLPAISVYATDPSASETLAGAPSDPGAFTFVRSGPLTSALTLNLNLAMTGTATNGVDYNTIGNFQLTFAAGSSTSTAKLLSVIDDFLVEGSETATLNVLGGLGYSVGANSSATVTITDDDFDPFSAVVDASDSGWYDSTGFHNPNNRNYLAGDAYGIYRNFYSFVIPNLNAPIVSAQLAVKTFDYGSGDPLEHYQLHEVDTAAATVLAGGSGLTGIFKDLGEGTSFGSRSYTNADDGLIRYIDLNAAAINAISAKIGQTMVLGGQVTSLDSISNHEYVFGYSTSPAAWDVHLVLNSGNALPLVSVIASDAIAAETDSSTRANPGEYTLFRTGPTANPLTVSLTMAGTASNGVDYGAIAGSITFAAGSASAVVPLTVIDDLLVEGSETATLQLVAASGYRLGADSSATVTIEDNDFLTSFNLNLAAVTPNAQVIDVVVPDPVEPDPVAPTAFDWIPMTANNPQLLETPAGKTYLHFDGSLASPTSLIDRSIKDISPFPAYLTPVPDSVFSV